MKRLLAMMMMICVTLSACLMAPPTRTPAFDTGELDQIAAQATQILINQATQTLTPTITPTASIQAGESDPTFRDDFNSTLRAGWTWKNENGKNWSLQTVPGSLQIKVDGGYVNLGNMPNLLLRPAPDEDFMIETSLLFDPKDNNQFAGLILYESNENFIQAGNSYCDPVNGCEGQGLYFDIYLDGNLTLPRVINKVELVSLSLRVTRQGNLFSFFTSPDGKVWYLVTRQEVAMKALQVGLVAGQNVDGNTPPAALFDYFEINKVE